MDLIVNGVNFEKYGSYQVSIFDLVEAIRNGNGTLIADRKATKRKIELTFPFLTTAEMSTVLNALADFQFSVTYHDPQTDANQTRTFYTGDRVMPMFRIHQGAIVGYKDFSLALIEV